MECFRYMLITAVAIAACSLDVMDLYLYILIWCLI